MTEPINVTYAYCDCGHWKDWPVNLMISLNYRGQWRMAERGSFSHCLYCGKLLRSKPPKGLSVADVTPQEGNAF